MSYEEGKFGITIHVKEKFNLATDSASSHSFSGGGGREVREDSQGAVRIFRELFQLNEGKDGQVMEEQKINRINELYRKSKAEGLSSEERREQKLLREEYLEAIRGNLRSQLNNIDIKEKDGRIVNLGEKYGSKKGN